MLKDFKRAFSLVELMVALIIVSCVVAALVPIVTKKLKSSGTTINSGSISEITTDCADNPNFGSDCKLCTKSYCINCGLNNCEADKYMDSKRCECKSCSEKYSDLCAACDSKGCTRCKTASYYINNGSCTICPEGSYCDGVNIYATCPGDGYYCDSTGIHKCAEKFSSVCRTCTSSKCKSCHNGYFISDGTCKSCEMGACIECTSTTHCTKCQGDWILDTLTNKCTKRCYEAEGLTGCTYCKNKDECSSCSSNYFLNADKKCTECTLLNCQKCLSNRPAISPACELCAAGYYLNSSGSCSSCSSKFGSQCVSCNANQCLSCKKGYHLKDITTLNACEVNDNKFNCSDSNFMQIGNLCFTRKNMGDSNILSLPQTVKTVAAGGDEACHAESEKCCWKGPTANPSACDSANGGYSGCNRTVCNWNAAKDICDNFNYAGKTWRLPTKDELTNLPYLYSIKLGAEGLMLCDTTSNLSSAQCNGSHRGRCLGSYGDVCYPYRIWTSSLVGTLYAGHYYLHIATWYGSGAAHLSYAYGVRCVTEMNSGE